MRVTKAEEVKINTFLVFLAEMERLSSPVASLMTIKFDKHTSEAVSTRLCNVQRARSLSGESTVRNLDVLKKSVYGSRKEIILDIDAINANCWSP